MLYAPPGAELGRYRHNLIETKMSQRSFGSQLDKRVAKYLGKHGRGNRFSDRRPSTAVAVKKARRMSAPSTGAKNVRGVLVGGPQGPERKKYETSVVSGYGVNTATPLVQSLTNNLAQGIQATQRIGDRVHVKAVDLQFNVVSGSNITTGVPEFVDVFLILDAQPQQTTAASTTIFANPATNLTYIDIDSLERFQILKRERIHLDTGSGVSHHFTWHQSCELAIRFDSGTAAPMSNDLLVCALSPSPNTSNLFPTVSFLARLTFTDE